MRAQQRVVCLNERALATNHGRGFVCRGGQKPRAVVVAVVFDAELRGVERTVDIALFEL